MLALPVAVWAVMAWRQRWVADDAFINFRVIDHLLAGHGPVFNLGERVEVATSPLWVALLTVAALVLPVPVEWIALLGGLGLSLAGLVLVQLAARRLLPGAPSFVVPAGALVVVALPPFWDFATSGLETGLSFAWLGACLFVLARPDLQATRAALLVGLGPLVRPDFAVFSAVFLVALLVLAGVDDRPSRRLRLVAIAAVAPVAFQVFRMGYYAALVPNTALAKEASLARWDQGWFYLRDLAGPYSLILPVVGLLALTWAPAVVRAVGRRDRRRAVLLVAPVLGAVLHALYVVRVGGDFMHGRLLLPALFVGLAPVAVVAIGAPAVLLGRALGATALLAWALVCGTSLRVLYPLGIGPDGVADERDAYVGPGTTPPVTIEDYAGHGWAEDGAAVAARLDDGRRVLLLHPQYAYADRIVLPRTDDSGVDGGADDGPDVVVAALNIGLLGQTAGIDAEVLDVHGLADPLASRLELGERLRPGHEKLLTGAWVLARYTDPSTPFPVGLPPSPATTGDIADAREALGCGEVPELFEAVSDPLTPGRFLANLTAAVRLHDLRVPADPTDAARQLCR